MNFDQRFGQLPKLRRDNDKENKKPKTIDRKVGTQKGYSVSKYMKENGIDIMLIAPTGRYKPGSSRLMSNRKITRGRIKQRGQFKGGGFVTPKANVFSKKRIAERMEYLRNLPIQNPIVYRPFYKSSNSDINKADVIAYINILGYGASYSGKNKTMYITPNAISDFERILTIEEAEEMVLNKFGMNIPFKLASVEEAA